MKEIYGMTFLEILIVAACISLIMSVVVPAYQASMGSERIESLALSASTRVEAIKQAVEGGVTDLASLDGGAFGIPADLPATATLHGSQCDQWGNRDDLEGRCHLYGGRYLHSQTSETGNSLEVGSWRGCPCNARVLLDPRS